MTATACRSFFFPMSAFFVSTTLSLRRVSRPRLITFESPWTLRTAFEKGQIFCLYLAHDTALRPILFYVETVSSSTVLLTIHSGVGWKRIVRCKYRLYLYALIILLVCPKLAYVICSPQLFAANLLLVWQFKACGLLPMAGLNPFASTIAFVKRSPFWLRCACQSCHSLSSWILARWYMTICALWQP